MAEYSQYKNLELPTSSDHYDINIFNKNAMVIDSELHKLDLKNESQDNLLATKEELSGEILRATTQENKTSENLSNHIMDKLNPHNITKYQVELGNVDNTSDINKPVSTAQQTAIDEALYQSNNYTDTKIAELINGAPETLNTLKEVADAIEEVKNNSNIAKEHADSQHARVDATKVEKSDINGNVKINGVETNVYTPSSSTELPLTTSLNATEEGVAALDSTVGKVLMDEIDEINSNLASINVYVGSDGKLHFTDSAGADTVIPFNSKKTITIKLNLSCSPRYATLDNKTQLIISNATASVQINNSTVLNASANYQNLNEYGYNTTQTTNYTV